MSTTPVHLHIPLWGTEGGEPLRCTCSEVPDSVGIEKTPRRNSPEDCDTRVVEGSVKKSLSMANLFFVSG